MVKGIVAGILVCAIAGALLIAWQPIKNFFLVDSCLDNGGLWASNGNYCIRHQCAVDGTCKPSYHNNSVCAVLTLPIAQDELYFKLGMPERQEQNVYTFAAGGGGPSIKATIIDGVATNLNCGL